MAILQSGKSVQTILILDANQRSALAVTRSLGRLPGVRLLTADETPTALAGASRYSSRYLRHPSPTQEPASFCQWLTTTIATENISTVIPTTEVTSRLLLMQAGRLGDCQIPFADLDTVMSLADKWRLINLAEKVGVPHPKSRFFPAASACTEPVTQYPVVVKPCLSRIWQGDHWLSSSVHVAYSEEELANLLSSKPYLKHHPFMLQEFIPGHGAGIFALYNRGRSIAFFAHRRIREKPPSGGVSVLSESVSPDPRMLELARRLLDEVSWHGVAMVEFRVTPSGEPFLMEVNTRFWGSLQLAIDAGVNFPQLLYRITQGESVEPVISYRIGCRLRWLLGDLDSLYLTLRDHDRFSPTQKWRRLLDFLTPHPFTTRHEVNRWRDIGPAWHEVRQYFRALKT